MGYNLCIAVVSTRWHSKEYSIFWRWILFLQEILGSVVRLASISWWRHQMETNSALLAICAANSSVTGEFPAQRPVTRSFDIFFHLRQIKRLNREAGDLRRHRTHYDVTVMLMKQWSNSLIIIQSSGDRAAPPTQGRAHRIWVCRRGTFKQSHDYKFGILENYHCCRVDDFTPLAWCRVSKLEDKFCSALESIWGMF